MGMEELTSQMNQRRAEVLQGQHRCLEREGLAPSFEDLQVTLRGRALLLLIRTRQLLLDYRRGGTLRPQKSSHGASPCCLDSPT